MSEPRLDWSTATVRKGKLTVAIDGELPRGWTQTFEMVAKLLDRGTWAEVGVKKRELRVGGVTPGGEDKLRHFLESVVQQANAHHRPAQEPSRSSDDPPDDEERGGEEALDAQMTERFRELGQAHAEPT